MKNILKSKKGLSTVVTTLIILVVSVLLATVVTFYTINITTNKTQQENLYMSKLHVWYNTTGSWAEAAFVLVNTGGKDIVLDKITCRSQTVDWANVFYYRNASLTVTSDLTVPTTQPADPFSQTVQGISRTFTNAADDITLKSGWTMVVYVNNPDHVASNDIGQSVEVAVYTANAFWSQVVNAEAAQ